MGLPMAVRLRAEGFRVAGFDVRTPGEFGEFARVMHHHPSRIGNADVLISVVRDEAETMALCFDDQAVYVGDTYPAILVICSTVSPRFVARLSSRLPQDVTLIDAPMSGAPFSAERGTLTFMVGGPATTVDRLVPMFECMGKRLFRAGPLGSGMTLKVLNNFVAASSVVAVRRSMAMADALNVDTANLLEVMAASSGATWFGNNFESIDWSGQGFAADNTIGILEKDVLSALDAVRDQEGFAASPLDQALLKALRSLAPVQSLSR